MTWAQEVQSFEASLTISLHSNYYLALLTVPLKGLSHEIDFKNFD